jgi:hypothetical protein
MRQKTRYIIIPAIFILLLVCPLLFTDWAGGKMSLTENRMLAPFPISINHTSGKLVGDQNGAENWISDNIGFRQVFVQTYTQIKNRVLGLTTSNHVLIGTDGWYYYTLDNNIEIATGEYPLNEKMLEDIAKYQQAISDYYHSVGKEYILMLTPSKVSIYPEYLPMSDRVVAITPVDIVADYLSKNTDVVVYNAKDTLLQHRSAGQLFHKTDTHWNDLGSYTAYSGLFEVMKQHGIISGDPIDVEFVEGDFRGEFSAMMGNNNLLPTEKAPIAQWASSSFLISEGEQFEKATAIQHRLNPAMGCAILQNDSINNGKTLQIYGDSQFLIGRKIPCYFAEHFSTVFNYAIRNISVSVDEIGNPDVIVFSCSERYIKDILTIPADVVIVADLKNLAPLTNRDAQDKGYFGMWIDFSDDQTVDQQGVIRADNNSGSDYLTLTGWAADFSTMEPLSALYLKVGDILIQCTYGTARQDVASNFGNGMLTDTGFRALVPVKYILEQAVSEIQFIQVGSDGSYQYAPVVYSINHGD